MGDRASISVPYILPRLKDADAAIRQWAAYSLGKIGPTAREAVPALQQMSQKDADDNARDFARHALVRITATTR